MTLNRHHLGSFLLMTVSVLWFADANSAVWVSTFSYDNDGSCRRSLPADQFLNYSYTERTELLGGCSRGILIKGEITERDASNFLKLISFSDQLYKRGEGALPEVWLNSEGGSVVAAISIAKAIRASVSMRGVGTTRIPVDSGCYSACVFILAGSYRRMVLGKVGIHRPYFIGDEYAQMGYKNLKQAYDGLYGKLTTLFKQWNLSRSLVDDMFDVESTDVRILTEEELGSYGLNKTDWVLTEEHNAEVRAVCGEEDLAESKAKLTFWDSPRGEECLRKINARLAERSKAKIRKLCGAADVNASDAGQRLSQGCLDKVNAPD